MLDRSVIDTSQSRTLRGLTDADRKAFFSCSNTLSTIPSQLLQLCHADRHHFYKSQLCNAGFNICSLACPSDQRSTDVSNINCLCLVWLGLLLGRRKAAQVQMPGAPLCLALARLTLPFPCKYFH